MEVIENITQTRKMQLSGGSTYIISLPKPWIDEMKIKVGESITIVKNSNESLTLYPREGFSQGVKRTAVIYSGNKDSGDSLKRKIIAAYLSGYKTIKIKTKGMIISPEHSKSIRELVHSSMIGTEIVESSSEELVIQILTRLPELLFEIALKRMFVMTVNMVKEAIEAFEEADIVNANAVVTMDDEVDRFGLYIRRNLILAIENKSILQDMGLQKPSDCLGHRKIVSRVERIADHASLIAKRTKFIEGKIDKKLLCKIKELSEKSLKVFEKSVTAVQEHSFEKGEEAVRSAHKVVDDEKNIMRQIKETEKNETILRFVLEDLRRISEYSIDIAEVAIDENIHSVISEE